MKKNVGIFLLVSILVLAIFSINAVYADTTKVTVTGMKGFVWNVTLNVINPSSGNLIVSVDNDTDATTGIANFYYDSASQTVTYAVIARYNGKIMVHKTTQEIGNYSTGAGITSINLLQGLTTTPTTTVVNTTPTTTISLNSSASDASDATNDTLSSQNSTTINMGGLFSSSSGALVKIKSWFSSMGIYVLYAVIGILILVAIIFLIIWIIKKRNNGGFELFRKKDDLVMSNDEERKIVKNNQSPFKSSSGDGTNRKIEDELASAEQKIKEAQEEIARIRSKKTKLTDAKQKYEQAKRELETAKEEIEGEY